jgi:hypothetical protein
MGGFHCEKTMDLSGGVCWGGWCCSFGFEGLGMALIGGRREIAPSFIRKL